MHSLRCYFGALVFALSWSHTIDGKTVGTFTQPQNDRVDVAVAALDSALSPSVRQRRRDSLG